ncbi:MAG: hypothetical protein IT462_15175 [Planctomycetes bacterium]|nr:hypothetical protein [Planctomycetota bacterium]
MSKRKRASIGKVVPPPDLQAVLASSVQGLTAKQTTALLALLDGKTHQEAATLAGVHRNRITDWLWGDAHFHTAYFRLLREIAQQRLVAMGTSFHSALRAMTDLVTDPDVKPPTKFKAATYLIDKALECDALMAHREADDNEVSNTFERVLRNRESFSDERAAFRNELGAAYDRTPDGKELAALNLPPPARGGFGLSGMERARRRELTLQRERVINHVPSNHLNTYKGVLPKADQQQPGDVVRRSDHPRATAREVRAVEEAGRERAENMKMAAELKEKLLRRRAQEYKSPNTAPPANVNAE